MARKIERVSKAVKLQKKEGPNPLDVQVGTDMVLAKQSQRPLAVRGSTGWVDLYSSSVDLVRSLRRGIKRKVETVKRDEKPIKRKGRRLKPKHLSREPLQPKSLTPRKIEPLGDTHDRFRPPEPLRKSNIIYQSTITSFEIKPLESPRIESAPAPKYPLSFVEGPIFKSTNPDLLVNALADRFSKAPENPLASEDFRVELVLKGETFTITPLEIEPLSFEDALEAPLEEKVSLLVTGAAVLEKRKYEQPSLAKNEIKTIEAKKGQIIKAIDEIVEKGVDKAGRLIASKWGKRGLSFVGVSGLAFALAACAGLEEITPFPSPIEPVAPEVFPTLVGPELPSEFVIGTTPTPEETGPGVPVWMPPTLEQATVEDGAGGLIPENLQGFDEVIRIGFAGAEISISEEVDFRSTGIGDDYRFVFVARDSEGDILWAKVGEGVNERYSDYPLHYQLVEFTGEDGNEYVTYVLDAENVRYEVIPDSEEADIVWGGSEGTLPLLAKDIVTLQDGTPAFSQYWDIKGSEWRIIPEVEEAFLPEGTEKAELQDDQWVALDSQGEIGWRFNRETQEWEETESRVELLIPEEEIQKNIDDFLSGELAFNVNDPDDMDLFRLFKKRVPIGWFRISERDHETVVYDTAMVQSVLLGGFTKDNRFFYILGTVNKRGERLVYLGASGFLDDALEEFPFLSNTALLKLRGSYPIILSRRSPVLTSNKELPVLLGEYLRKPIMTLFSLNLKVTGGQLTIGLLNKAESKLALEWNDEDPEELILWLNAAGERPSFAISSLADLESVDPAGMPRISNLFLPPID